MNCPICGKQEECSALYAHNDVFFLPPGEDQSVFGISIGNLSHPPDTLYVHRCTKCRCLVVRY